MKLFLINVESDVYSVTIYILHFKYKSCLYILTRKFLHLSYYHPDPAAPFAMYTFRCLKVDERPLKIFLSQTRRVLIGTRSSCFQWATSCGCLLCACCSDTAYLKAMFSVFTWGVIGLRADTSSGLGAWCRLSWRWSC